MLYLIFFIVYSLSLPFLRPLASYLEIKIDFSVFSLILIIIGIASLLAYLFLKRERRLSVYFSLAVLFILTFRLLQGVGIKFNIEKIHIIEYLILSFSGFLFMKKRVKDSGIYIWSILLCSLVAVNDEVIQGIIAGRFFDSKDIILNLKVILLGHVYLLLVFRWHDHFKGKIKIPFSKITFISFCLNLIYLSAVLKLIIIGKSIDWEAGGYLKISLMIVALGFICVLLNTGSLFYYRNFQGDKLISFLLNGSSDLIILSIIIGKIAGIVFG